MEMTKVIIIVGPTAIGKTDIAIELCHKYNGEVINADASQFKRKLNIGTAKININEIDVAHHLIDVIEPTENYSIYDYQIEARKIVELVSSKGKIPFIVGGTGLYVNSLIYDYDLSASPRKLDEETKYDNLSNEELFDILKKVDYQSSLTIHMNNRKRVLRAISVAKEGKKISENKASKMIYDALIICLDTDREVLYSRINERVKVMIENGLVNECLELQNSGIDLKKISDIGYKEIGLYLDGTISLNESIDLISLNTRHLAKRQMTWFRNKIKANFVNINYFDLLKTISDISILIDTFLNK